MEQGRSCEAASRSATQQIPKILQNPEIQYYVHKNPLLVPTFSQINPIHTTPSYLSQSHFNIILAYLSFPSGLFPSCVPPKSYMLQTFIFVLLFETVAPTCFLPVQKYLGMVKQFGV
jgi:hypothetical protein